MRWTRHIADKNLKKMNYFCSPFVVFYKIMNEMSKKRLYCYNLLKNILYLCGAILLL